MREVKGELERSERAAKDRIVTGREGYENLRRSEVRGLVRY